MQRIRIAETRVSLCDTCRFATKRRAIGTNRTYILCMADQMGHSTITAPMEECGSYSNRMELQLYEMKKLEWLVDNNKKSNIGFRHPGDIPGNDGAPKELEGLEDRLPWQLR